MKTGELKIMAFGKKYEYDPVPQHLQMLLVAYPEAGKTTFAAQFVPQGKIGVVIDADGRFDEVVAPGMNFHPLSDEPSDNLDPKRIHDIVKRSMPNKDVGLFVVDSVTAIIEPIILNIQREVEEGKSKGARGYKEKADAMKYLQAGLSPWGVDVIYIYHYRDRGNAQGTIEKTTSITTLELARLYRNINIKCEIILDKNGKRGVKVLEARGGRTGMTLWDDSGKWENIRARLEEAVWGGLTKEEQDKLVKEDSTNFTTPTQAVGWAWTYSQEHGEFFKDAKHAENAYNELKKVLFEELKQELTAPIMYEAWRQEVYKRETEKQTTE